MMDESELVKFQCLSCGKDLEMPKSNKELGSAEFGTKIEYPWVKACPDCDHKHKYDHANDKVISIDNPS